MKATFLLTFAIFATVTLSFPGGLQAANVNAGTGYTNDFSSQPAAADWTTRSFATGSGQSTSGEITNATGLDATVQTNSASMFSAQCASASGTPPSASGTAVWSSAGGYLQTRPTSVAATLLMARLVNNTGTNATVVHINYDYTTNRTSAAIEEVAGHLVYYSLTGTANNWSNIAALSLTSQGRLSVDLTLSGIWTNGATLYLLWADDNGSGSPDTALDIDNFFASVIGGATLSASCSLTAPTNAQSFGAPATVTLTAAANPGPGATITGVGFYEVTSGFLACALSASYSTNVNFNPGLYAIYAVETNSLGAIVFSGTNTISVTNVPFSAALTSPANGLFYGAPATVSLTATANPGSGATITGVGFFEATSGFLASASGATAPYTTNVILNAGVYALYAVATNSLGASVVTGTNTITVTNVPFSAVLTSPANGLFYGAPASVSLAATANPGTGATITGVGFFDVTTGFLGSALTAPYTNTAVLGAGTYKIFAQATNSLGATAVSGTNTISVTNIPLSVVLASPADGAAYGSPATVTCQAAVTPGSSGVPISSVAFYMVSNGNNNLLFTDISAPYSNQLAGLSDGSYRFYAVVTNNLSATACSTTNTITVSSMVSGTVTRGPYLGSRGLTNITIRWRTTETTVGRVRFGPAPGSLTAFADDTTSRTDHSVTVNGLTPDSKYYYSIGTTAGTVLSSTNYYFFTAPPVGANRLARLWFLTDYGGGDATQIAVRDAYLNYTTTNGHATDVWLTGGDNEQSTIGGADATYQTTVFNVYSNIFQNMPVFPTCGNHDGGSSSAYWTIYSQPTQGECGGVPSGSQHYYSFDYANIHFISLDAYNNGNGAAAFPAQLQWLTNDLASTTQAWIIAYWHEPPYCKNFYDSDTEATCKAARENFNPVLEAYGVDLVMSGHCHALQRTYLINQHYGIASTFTPTNQVDAGDGRPDGSGAYQKTTKRGTVYVTAPAGCGLAHPGSGTMPAFVERLSYTIYGCLVIDVNSNRLDFKMLSSAGDMSDYFTLLKGASQSAPPALPVNFTATASGTSANLAWSNNATNEAAYSLECSVNGADFAEIASIAANLTTFTNTSLNFANAYYYRLRAWNSAGYSDYTAFASLTPSGTLAIDRQPQSITNYEGVAASLYVLARGTGPITYQWYDEARRLSGQTNSTLNWTSLAPTNSGHYTVVVSNGGTPLTSAAAVVAVIPITVMAPITVGSPQMTNGFFGVTFQATPFATYTIQSADVLNGSWNNRTNVMAPLSGLILIQDAPGSTPQRFYRLKYPPE